MALPIPDDDLAALGGAGDVSRCALEAFAAQEYRAGRLTHPELRRRLGLAIRAELERLLRIRGIVAGVTSEAGEHEQRDRDVAAR
ncbi:MAG TPA: hypothetical protein VFW75_03740 [Acetobacteraceae bacterium]|nr:hypothetical protein [Acetobacteraceae bacterium]